MLEIKLFGSPTIRLNGKNLQASISEQTSAILCYLILNRHRPIHRDTIVGQFWRDSGQENARKSLRTAIWRIRSAVEEEGCPPILMAESELIWFNTEIPYWLDIEAFATLYEEAQTLRQQFQLTEAAALLRKAVRLYSAELLEGWSEEWILYERTRFETLYLTVLTELMGFHGSIQDFPEAIRYGNLMLHHDPLLESIHRHLMLFHYRAGNRPAAIRQYLQCQDFLRSELQIEPMEETRRLFEQIRNESGLEFSGPLEDVQPVPEGRDEGPDQVIRGIIQKLRVVQNDLGSVRDKLEQVTGKRIA